MHTPRQIRFGPLDAVALEAGSPEKIAVFCHGFGAPGTDLVPIGEELARLAGPSAAATTFLFPAALLSLAEIGWGDARAWWMIDVARLQAGSPDAAVEMLRKERPDGAVAAGDQLEEFLAAAHTHYGCDAAVLTLGGFSQGAMLSAEVAMRLETPPRLLALFSGALVSESVWKERADRLTGTAIVQAHGRQDMVLPYASAEALRGLLTDAGCEVSFVPFDGGHTIVVDALREVAAKL
ncbi:MAG: lysophospholipase [Planctomycetota bacterium]